MPGGEQENLRSHYAGPLPSSFRAGDILGPRCLSPLDEGSPALSAKAKAHSIPAYRVFLDLQSSWRMTCERPIATCAATMQSTPLQVYFFSYILPYSSLASPNFLIEDRSCPWRIVGLLEDVKCNTDNGSYLLFLQIVIPRRSQRTRTPEEPFPVRLFTPHQPEAGDWKGFSSLSPLQSRTPL
jgi:hypothetical protein